MSKSKKGLVLGFIRDLILSVSASLFSILLLRWVTSPIGGFTVHLLKWLCLSLVASALAFFFTKYYKRDRDVVSRESLLHLVVVVLIKDGLLALCLLAGFVSFPSIIDCVLLIFADMLFTLFICQYVRISQGSEVRRIRQLSAAKSALVMGTDSAAVAMAKELGESGNYLVMGLVSDDIDMEGRIIGNFPVYYVSGPIGVERLKWKIGGIDCIFFPRTQDFESLDTELDNEEKLLTDENIATLNAFAKRTFDVVVSFILLAVFSPLI